MQGNCTGEPKWKFDPELETRFPDGSCAIRSQRKFLEFLGVAGINIWLDNLVLYLKRLNAGAPQELLHWEPLPEGNKSQLWVTNVNFVGDGLPGSQALFVKGMPAMCHGVQQQASVSAPECNCARTVQGVVTVDVLLALCPSHHHTATVQAARSSILKTTTTSCTRGVGHWRSRARNSSA